MTDLAPITADLAAEQQSLDDVVAELTPEQWATPTPSPGWAVRDQIGHLTYFDGTATLAITDEARFQASLESLMTSGDRMEAVTLFREGKDPVLLVLMAFAAVIVAPLCEEVVFRGYVYPVAKKFTGARAGALFSALVFAAAHGNVAALVPLFVFGLALLSLSRLSPTTLPKRSPPCKRRLTTPLLKRPEYR